MKKFTDIVSKDKVSGFEQAARHAIANRAWLENSFEIALLILLRLKVLNWTQVKLAEEMKVSPQYVNKIVKGRENLTLETIALLEIILGIPLIAIECNPYQRITAITTSSALIFSRTNYKPVAKAKPAEVRKSYEVSYIQPLEFETAA